MNQLTRRFFLALVAAFSLDLLVVWIALRRLCAAETSIQEVCASSTVVALARDLLVHSLAPLAILFEFVKASITPSAKLPATLSAGLGTMHSIVLLGTLSALFLASIIVGLRIERPGRSFSTLFGSLLLWFFFAWTCSTVFV